MITTFIITTTGISITALIVFIIMRRKLIKIEEELKKSNFSLRSAYVKFGKSFEHFVPFTKNFPADKEKTVFLGMPIDFISFEDDKIKFIEVKTGTSQLSPKQTKIKQQIQNGKVEFIELKY